MGSGFDYDVFVSYRHDQLDQDVTARLQDELQSFGSPWYRPRSRMLRVFRDQTSLATSPDLWGSIESAMSASRWLLLVASPRSARSPGVRREVKWWREKRGTATICIAVTDGELRWDDTANDFDWEDTTALSREVLERAFDSEPAWIDLRSFTSAVSVKRRGLLRRFARSLTDPRLQDATASLIAQIKDVPKDTLIGEHLRRSRQLTRAVVSTLLILVLFLAASVAAASIAVVQRDRAVRQGTVSEAGLLAAMAESLVGSKLDLAELFATEAYKLDPDAQTRAALFQVVTADPYLVRYLQATGTVSAVAGSLHGTTAVAGTVGGDVLSWDLAGFKRVLVAKLPGAVSSVAVSADGGTIAAADASQARIWVRGRGARSVPIPARWTVYAAAVSPSGRYAAFAVDASYEPADAIVLVHESAGRMAITRVPIDNRVTHISFSGESQLVFADTPDTLWERLTVPSLAKMSEGVAGFGAQLRASALSPTGKFISVANEGIPLPVWTASAGSARSSYPPPLGASEPSDFYPDSMAISADGRRVAYANSGTIYVSVITAYRDATSSTILPLAGNKVINSNGLAFLGLGHSELLSASDDLVAFWNLNQSSRISTRIPAEIPMGCDACGGAAVSVSPKGNYAIITADNDQKLTAVALPMSAGHLYTLPWGTSQVPLYGPVVWSPDGRRFTVYTPSDSGGEVWSVSGHPVLLRRWVTTDKKLDSPDNPPLSAVPAADGRLIVEIDPGHVVLRDAATGVVERVTRGVSGNVAAVDQRAEYAAVISGTSAEQLSIVDLTTGATSPVPGGPVSTVAYSGELMLVARTDGTLEVRSADGQHLFHSFAGLVNPIAGPVVASTGLVVELGSDGSAAVFDLGSGQELGTITLPASRTMIYTGIGFSSNGNQLVTATPTFGGPQGPGDITDWDFSPTAWSQIACATAGHQLTETEWNEYVGPGGPSMPSQRACG